jgi:hypothetical protein
MRSILADDATVSSDNLLRRTADLFGIVRLGANVRTRLEAVHGTLRRQDDDEESAEVVPDTAITTPQTNQLTESAQVEQESADVTPIDRASASDASIDRIVMELEGYVPDFNRVDDYAYFDAASQASLSTDLKRLVNEIALDPTFDGSPRNSVVVVRTTHLSIDDANAVSKAASLVWGTTFGEAMNRAAQRIAVHLARDPEFDPLPWEEDVNQFVSEHMLGQRPPLVALVQRQLNLYAAEQGLTTTVEAEIKADARKALDAMSPLERDVYGFTSRNAKRLHLAEPYLADVREGRRRFVVYWMSRFDNEEQAHTRDARYATASRRLIAEGHARAEVSRVLGISSAIIDRIERESRTDVVLLPDDPILTQLAPSLR